MPVEGVHGLSKCKGENTEEVSTLFPFCTTGERGEPRPAVKQVFFLYIHFFTVS